MNCRLSGVMAGAMAISALTFGALCARATVAGDSPLRRAPVLAEAEGQLPQAELLCTPEVRTLVGYTRRLLQLHDGKTVGLFSFSDSAPANWIFLVNTEDCSAERFLIPNDDIGSHGGTLGADGNIYIMPYHGHAYRFDVVSHEFSDLGNPFSEREYTWEALGASNGCIYFGTYPNAYFGEYNPGTGKFRLWRQIAENTKYVTSFSEDEEGRVHCLAWGPESAPMVFDPKTGELAREPEEETQPGAPAAGPGPSLPAGDTEFGPSVATSDGRVFVLTRPSSRLWERGPSGELALRGEGLPEGEMWRLDELPGGRLFGWSVLGAVFRFDIASGEMVWRQLPNEAAGGNPIMFVEAVTPRCVIGANFSQQNLFRVDPETGEWEESGGMVARVSGEVMCALGLRGRAYLGIYVHSLVYLYDPEQPFGFATNPVEVLEVGNQQTCPGGFATDGRLVFMSSQAQRATLGGALTVIDSESGESEVYRNIVQDQNLRLLAYDGKTGLVFGGTDRWGLNASHPPAAESAVVFAFDGESRSVVKTLAPWPEADTVEVLGVDEGVVVATGEGEIALLEAETLEVLYKGECPVDIPRRLVRGSDGFLYGLSDGVLMRWDLGENTITPVGETDGCRHLCEPSPGTFVTADSTSVYRLRLR